MTIPGKAFSRRPWDLLDNGLIRHYDNIHVEGPPDGARGIYLCLHTRKDFLQQNNIECVSDDGFYWESLILENFSVKDVKNADGVFITDGKIRDKKLELSVINGTITGLVNSRAISITYLNLTRLYIENLSTTGTIDFRNCDIDKLVITDSKNLKFSSADCKLRAIELRGCEAVDVSCFGIKPEIFPYTEKQTVFGALAINISIDGAIYGLDIPSQKLTLRSLK